MNISQISSTAQTLSRPNAFPLSSVTIIIGQLLCLPFSLVVVRYFQFLLVKVFVALIEHYRRFVASLLLLVYQLLILVLLLLLFFFFDLLDVF